MNNTLTRIERSTNFLLLIFSLLNCLLGFSQENTFKINYTPDGIFDKVFDKEGTMYDLSDIIVGKSNVEKSVTSTSVLLCTSGIFELYFETGCGMENTSIAIHNQRRAILCQAFQDISDFINTPLKNSGNITKIKIWVRNPASLTPAMPAAAAGVASAFYNLPIISFAFPFLNLANNSGIVDNEIWKTIHTGVNSYANSVFPIINTNQNSGFYHGFVAFNFGGTTNWNLDYTKYNAATGYLVNSTDFYTTIIHEVTHALGFNSLIKYNGKSQISFPNGIYGDYFTRYDKMLKTSTNISLLSNIPATGGAMYDFNFSTAINNLYPGCSSTFPTYPIYNGNSGQFNCPTSIKYVGSVTSPVYNPPCYENGSSLSHFEDACYNSNINDQYFMMSDRSSGLLAKRFLTPEERQVLCDIGYSVKGTFGNASNFTFKNYNVSDCSGINVAGVNDGFIPTGAYAFQGNSGADITVSGILNNDYTGALVSNLRFEFVQDIYDPNAILSVTSGSASTSFTIKSYVPGLHLLRYVPYDISSGQRGNITYIFVNVLNSCIINNPCSLVRNGNFEEHNYPPTFNGQIYKACGWQNASYISSPDYFNSDYTSISYPGTCSIPCNNAGYQNDNITGNHAYAGMYISPNGSSESIKTELISSLLPNTQYKLTFDVSLAESSSKRSFKFQAFITDQNLDLTTYGTIPSANITANTIFLTNTNFSNAASAAPNGWEKITFNFTTGSNTNLKYLYIGGLNNLQFQVETPLPLPASPCSVSVDPNIESYYYLDNVSLESVLPSNFLDAVNDDFNNMPISSLTGGVTTSVYANDIYNGLPSSSASLNNVSFELVAPISIAGASINQMGLITIPSGIPSGMYLLTYRLNVIGNCSSSVTANVIITISSGTKPTLAPGIRANYTVSLIGMQSSGKAIISGWFSAYNNITQNHIARLNSNLTLDSSFISSGPSPLDNCPNDLAIQSDNKIIVVGDFNGFSGGTNGFGIARLLLNGSIDPAFNVGGTGTSRNDNYTGNSVKACAIQSNGSILVGGDFYYYNGVKRLGIVRLTSNGDIDLDFNPSELNTYYRSVVNSILVQPDGNILLLGFFTPPTGGVSKNIIRLYSNGLIDPNFIMGNTIGSIGIENLSTSLLLPLSKMTLLPDGKIIVVGGFTKYNGNDVKCIVKLTANGQIDLFNTTLGVERAINDVIIEPNTNNIIIGGEFTTFGTIPVKKLIRLTNLGDLDTTFSIGIGTSDNLIISTCPFCTNYVKILKRQLDGKIIIGGKFSTFNGLSATNITRIFGDFGAQAKTMFTEYRSEPEIDTNFDNNLVVYPNPSKDVFNIDLTQEVEEFTSISIYNLLGEKVYTSAIISKENNSINLSQLSNGYYIARLESNTNSAIIKLIKN